MKKRTIFLISWIAGFALLLLFATIAQSFEEESAAYNIFMFIAVAFMVAAIVLVVFWKKTCPSCKVGKLKFTGYEDGEPFMTTSDVNAGESVKRNSKGEVISRTKHTKKETYEVTPTYKVYECDHCDYKKNKVKSTRRTS